MENLTTILITILLTLLVVGVGVFIRKLNPLTNFYKFMRMMVSTGDEVSSKRVIALVAFILMAISYAYGIATQTNIPEYFWEGFLYIVLAAFFSNVVEKFRKNDNRH